jgi:hypothetical protein
MYAVEFVQAIGNVDVQPYFCMQLNSRNHPVHTNLQSIYFTTF